MTWETCFAAASGWVGLLWALMIGTTLGWFAERSSVHWRRRRRRRREGRRLIQVRQCYFCATVAEATEEEFRCATCGGRTYAATSAPREETER